MTVKKISGLCDIVNDYDLYIIDLWGVVHNGVKAFNEAVIALEQLKELNKTVVFLSNAPRREAIARTQLEERGIKSDLYSQLYTSGEDCYKRLLLRDTPFYSSLGNRLFHLGPEKDRSLFEETTYLPVSSLKEADFVLNTGPLSWSCQVSDYEKILKESFELKLPMICSNPDKVVVHNQSFALCAGALAEFYETLGGNVTYHGKPFASIYKNLFSLLPTCKFGKILVIGDSLSTDIKGANNIKVDSLLVLSGIHGNHIENLEMLYEEHNTLPTFLGQKLSW